MTDLLLSQLDRMNLEAQAELTDLESRSQGSLGQEATESFRLKYLGKKGLLSEVLKQLGSLPPEERSKIGALANRLRSELEARISGAQNRFAEQILQKALESETEDVTLPPRLKHLGSLHPITQTIHRIRSILEAIGFQTVEGPEVETDAMNFEAANTPENHPARDMQDTFYLGAGVLLRTQTTAIQARVLRAQSFPVRILCPGAVYRKDNDATHSPMFHQIEGLWVDRGVSLADLKGTLLYLSQELFGSSTQIRLRPSYFPFVEPGAEVDVSCFACAGKKPDCRICKGTGWVEILGAGMVHPEMLRAAGYPADEVSGFAFGLGVDRIAMILHEIPDLRLMFQNDVRFLRSVGEL